MINSFIIDYNLANEERVDILKENLFFPFRKSNYFIEVFVSENSNVSIFENNQDLPIKEFKIDDKDLSFLLDDFSIKLKLYNLAKNSVTKDQSDNSHIKEFFNTLIEFAIYKKSSDIHIESDEDSLIVRFRIDGMLLQFFRFEKSLEAVLSSVIKLHSNLDITQKRLSQNGRFSQTLLEKSYDFRVSIMPTIYGESIVIRVLDNYSINKDLTQLGFKRDNLMKIKKEIIKSNGLILVTGPTGSGKTTTLYSIIKELKNSAKKIITIEDPVEYKIKDIQQISINEEIGLNFRAVLKDILRQDPDIIMIGEIRDEETLNIAIQASLTGHLVISSIHTNDSISTINRLLDLKAKPYLIASTLKAIISQRLILKLCEHCKIYENGKYISKGCNSCNLTGFKNREVISEVFLVNEEIAQMIRENKNVNEIMLSAKNSGFLSIYEDAKNKIKRGVSVEEEILKVLN